MVEFPKRSCADRILWYMTCDMTCHCPAMLGQCMAASQSAAFLTSAQSAGGRFRLERWKWWTLFKGPYPKIEPYTFEIYWHIMVMVSILYHNMINISIIYDQWEIQDPKMGVLYHIRPYFVGIFPYIGLIYGRYLQFRFLKWPVIWWHIKTILSFGGYLWHQRCAAAIQRRSFWWFPSNGAMFVTTVQNMGKNHWTNWNTLWQTVT